MNLVLDGELGEHVAAVADGTGWYAGAEEYLRDLIGELRVVSVLHEKMDQMHRLRDDLDVA